MRVSERERETDESRIFTTLDSPKIYEIKAVSPTGTECIYCIAPSRVECRSEAFNPKGNTLLVRCRVQYSAYAFSNSKAVELVVEFLELCVEFAQLVPHDAESAVESMTWRR